MEKKHKLPFRVGRKQKRAVLDADGLEVVIFPKGAECLAEEYVKFKNEVHQRNMNLNLIWSSEHKESGKVD